MENSTVGAKEFYEMKHRMVEFLVEEMGYRVVAIDAEFGDIKIVNDYILNGVGSIDEVIWALRNFSWSATKEKDNTSTIVTHAYLASWTTTEFTAMIEWMKKFNEDPGNENKIKFYGIDMELPENSIDDLFGYLDKADEGLGTNYSGKLSDLVIIHGFNIKYPTSRSLGLFLGMMEELEEIFITNKEKYIEKTSATEYEIAKHDLEVIMGWGDYRNNNLKSGTIEALSNRNYHMAENVKWILEFEKQNGNDKVIVWAHNRSIAKKGNLHSTMGEHLKETFGEEYYAIGLDFYEGRFRAYGVDIWGNPISNYLAKFSIGSSPKNTLAYALEKTGLELSLLDFQSALGEKEVFDILSNPQLIHNIGLMYPGRYTPSRYTLDFTKRYSSDIPMDSYDGFLFVKEISETTGAYDKRDTKIEDGDKAIISHYIHILFGQISTIVSIIIVTVLIFIFVYKKIKKKKDGKGARYPNSDRWD